MDIINIINTVLCGLILVMGLMSKCSNAKLIGVAFGVFGFSHVMEMMGMAASMETLLVYVRVLAYVMVAYAMLHLLKK